MLPNRQSFSKSPTRYIAKNMTRCPKTSAFPTKTNPSVQTVFNTQCSDTKSSSNVMPSEYRDKLKHQDSHSTASCASNNSKYATPQLNTLLGEGQQIKDIFALEPKHYNAISDLTPRSKAVVTQKVSHRMNFNADDVVFKNLTPINVNDSVLSRKYNTCKKKILKNSTKMAAPELTCFLESIPTLEHNIPEPAITQQFYQEDINPYDSFIRMYN